MKLLLPIPKDEQLHAAACGWKAIYEVLERYELDGDVNALSYRTAFSISEKELAEYFRNHAELARTHVIANDVKDPYHEIPIIRKSGEKYIVYANDHGHPHNIRTFDTLYDAAAAYIFYFW